MPQDQTEADAPDLDRMRDKPVDARESRGDADRGLSRRGKTDQDAASKRENDDKDDTKEKFKDEESEDGKAKKKSKWPLIILAAVVVIGLIGGGIYWFLTRNQITTDDAYTTGRPVMIAPQVGGRVVNLAVNDNQFVRKGDLLVQLDPGPYVAARDQAQGQLAQAQAQLANARVALDKAKTTFPAQLAQAKGQLEQAQGTLYRAKSDFQRQRSVSKAATTQQDIDQSDAAYRTAQGQVQVAQAQVQQAELVPQNIAQAEADVRQLEGQVTQAKGNLETAELNLSYAHVVAPQDGTVTNRNVEMGNYLQPGTQIMAIVAPQVWIVANFKETDLTRIRPGQKVDIEVDAYPDLKLKGHVDSVQLGSGSVFSAFPAQNATGNFVKIVQRVPVKLLIDSGLPPDQSLPLGLSVVPTVYLE